MKRSLVKILAETGKVSCFAALLLCAGNVQAGEPKYKVDASEFKCITKLTSVKHFFVDNLSGNLAGTVDVAKAGKGQYPEGTVLQLIPNEVMVKQQKGFSPATNDWEFFALDTDKNGTKIVSHGAEEVNNFLGLNCSECHKAARAEFDFVCEQDHGCAEERVGLFGIQGGDALGRIDRRSRQSDHVLGARPGSAAQARIPEDPRAEYRQGKGRHRLRHQGHVRAGRHAAADDGL